MEELDLMQLCAMAENESDKEIKKKINSLIARKLCTNRHDLEKMENALNEPLRHNKTLKKSKTTRYTYVAK